MPNVSGMQGVLAHLQRLKLQPKYSKLISKRCKFCKDAFCEKQQMKCFYITNQCNGDYFKQVEGV